jgi:hypothetical protein
VKAGFAFVRRRAQRFGREPTAFSVRGIPQLENIERQRIRAEFAAARRAMQYQIFAELP